MIKSDAQSTSGSKQDALTHGCWQKEAGIPAVRFELGDGRMVVLPYQHFGFAWFESNDGEDGITVNFASHEAVIKGRDLLKLLTAFQKQTVECVRLLPNRHEKLLEKGDGLVTGIEVRSLLEEEVK